MVDRSKLIQPDDVSDKPFIFVSYSRQDMYEVQSVLQILRNNHFRFWYDMGLKSGTEWAEELGEKIDQCDQFLVLISDHSVNSKYVRKEIGMATDKDKNILVLYLTETNLTSGLHLLLGDIQAIHREFFTLEDDFEREICKAVSNNTLYQNNDMFCNGADLIGDAKSELLKNYSLLSQIGAGGIGQVFLAEQKRTGTLVAVKWGSIDDSYRGTVTKDCFYAEKRVLSEMLRNMCPYVPIILDWFQDEEQIFLVETMITGESLKSNVSYSEEKVVEIARKALKILNILHRNNIIYRDIKPSNLIRDQFGEIYLIDFNTAIWVDENSYEAETLLGTVGFAPPEQYNGKAPTNFSSDIYALGRTMEYLLCPEHFDKNGKAPIRYYRRDVSVELEAIIEKMTNPTQSLRYRSTEQLLQVFEDYRKIHLLNKIRLAFQSWKRLKNYSAFENQSRHNRENALKEIAAAQDEYVGERFYETVILSNPDVKVSAED